MARPKSGTEPFVNIAVRLPRSVAERLDAAAAKLAARALGMAPSQSHAARLSIERGLPSLEAELTTTTTTAPSKRTK